MSTFDGKLNEFPNISIDRFDGENLKSKVFFLSHCHQDHMLGLGNPYGLPGPLYVHPISAVILKHQYSNIKDIKCLDIGVPTPISYKTDESEIEQITVTTMPAGHCPGSIMFLFEKNYTKVLYTGDFRLRLKDLQRYAALKDASGNPRKLDAIYVDSTFFDKHYSEFPTQFESNKAIEKLIRDWLETNSNNLIVLQLSARYGYEFLFKHISQTFQTKIHINESELEKYEFIPELDGCFSTDCRQCQIHACFSYRGNGQFKSCSVNNLSSNVRIIKPSALIWTKWNRGNEIVSKDKYLYRVCYSNHSGFNEIHDFINYLQPKRIELNVIPDNPFKRTKMNGYLNEIMSEYQIDVVPKNETVTNKNVNFKNIQLIEERQKPQVELEEILKEDNDYGSGSSKMILKRRRTNFNDTKW